MSALPNCPACGRACDADEDGAEVFCRAPLSECPYGRFVTVAMHRVLVEQAAKAAAFDESVSPNGRHWRHVLAEERARRGLK